jgi:hypothetical protein
MITTVGPVESSIQRVSSIRKSPDFLLIGRKRYLFSGNGLTARRLRRIGIVPCLAELNIRKIAFGMPVFENFFSEKTAEEIARKVNSLLP